MSRKILFKGKRKDWKELPKEEWWVDGYCVHTEEKAYIILDIELDCIDGENTDLYAIEWYEVDKDTAGQYTGLTDKNGRKIFEGDIVKIHQFLFDGCEYEKEIIVSIEYMEDMACFGANLLRAKEIREYMGYDNETDKEEKVVVPLCNLYGLHEESFEVIGNIYENADLLKEVDG